VVTDVLGQAGALPLLSSALVGTWERQRENRLTVAGYLAAGGVEGALTRNAEAAYSALDDRGRDVAHQLLVRLADSEEGGALVRRAVPLTELDLHGELGSARRAVVETFVARRLLAVDDERLEVAHEALLTSWPRLARWLDDDADGRVVRRHVAPAALEWDRDGRPVDQLYRGARLAPALDWASAPGSDPTPLERDFLEASRAHADAELREARDRAEREAAGRRRNRRLAAGLAAVLVVALVATGLAVVFQRRADRRAAEADAASIVADANRLAALSTTAGSLGVSMLLAAEAVRLAETPETQDGLLAALTGQPKIKRRLSFNGIGFDAGLADVGRVLFVAAGNRVIAWEVASERRPHTVLRPPGRPATWDTFDVSPTDGFVVIGGNGLTTQDGDVAWLRVNDSAGTERLWLEDGELRGSLVAAAFSEDGRNLLVLLTEPTGKGRKPGWTWWLQTIDLETEVVRAGGVEGRFTGAKIGPVSAVFADDASAVSVWPERALAATTTVDLTDGSRSRLALDDRRADSNQFLPLPTGVAQLWDDGAVTLYDDRGRAVQVLDGEVRPVRDLLVSRDGAWAATVGDRGLVILWDIDPSTGRWSRGEELVGHGGQLMEVELDPRGRTLFTLSLNATIAEWDLSGDAGFGSTYPALAGRWVANRPQTIEPGQRVVAPTRPGSDFSTPVFAPETLSVAATFFEPETGRVVDQVVVGDTLGEATSGSSVAVSPDRRMVAVTSGLATTVLDAHTRDVLGTISLPPRSNTLGRSLPAELVWCAGWTPDGSRLLIGAEGDVSDTPDLRGSPGVGALVVVDSATWEVQRRIETGSAPQAIETSPDGRLIAVAMNRAEVQILDAVTLERLRTVPLGGIDWPADLSFSPDGSRLAVGGFGRLLHILDTATWRPVHEPVEVHDGALAQVEWMRDGRTVVTSGFDGTVALVDVRRGLVRARPLPSSSEPGIGRAYLIADVPGELIALRGNLTGRRYPMRPFRWLAEACRVAGRDLTKAEWNRYLPDRPYRRTCTPPF
jgi:WD40 repeat protein